MIIHLKHRDKAVTCDLSKPLDISLPMGPERGPVAWGQSRIKVEPVTGDHFIGLVEKGASVNFQNILFNPHAHGTHTEGVGHITPKVYNVNQSLTRFFFWARLVSIEPEFYNGASSKDKQPGDRVITKGNLLKILGNRVEEAVLIRTLPNDPGKKNRRYSGSNPPFITGEAAAMLRALDVKHLIVDLPSVDREDDGGLLDAHRAFWGDNQSHKNEATITELAYIPDSIVDGLYLLDLQLAPFDNDATPSRPVLYVVTES